MDDFKLPAINQAWSRTDIEGACKAWRRPDLWAKYNTTQHAIPFSSDGPSCFPRFISEPGENIDLYPAAAEHDMEYYLGEKGDEKGRMLADLRLAMNVIGRCHGSSELAMIIFQGVRIGGKENLPTPWKWGFGRINSGDRKRCQL